MSGNFSNTFIPQLPNELYDVRNVAKPYGVSCVSLSSISVQGKESAAKTG